MDAVTGGAGVLGLCAARALLEHGASGIAIFDMADSISSSQASIASLADEFPNAAVLAMVVDVTDENIVEAAVVEAAGKFGTVDMLLCFAGIVSSTDAIDMAPASWRKVLEVNTTGSWLCAQAVAR